MVDNWGSIIFIVFYLGTIWSFLIQILHKNPLKSKFKNRDSVWKWIFLSYFLLGFGDIFHLGFRIIIFLGKIGLDSSFAKSTMAFGYIATGITMTYFYIALVHAWVKMYGKEYANSNQIKIYYLIAYFAFATRLILMLLPYNHWYDGDATVDLGFNFRIITSSPLYIIGGLIIYLYWKSTIPERKKQESTIDKDRNKANFNAMIWYIVSYICYSLTIFLVSLNSLMGLFMIPKTIAYLIAFYYHYKYILNK
ncbi:MAG: hypothetical protein ACTSWL_01475 [Promethearchaeota archaeon]